MVVHHLRGVRGAVPGGHRARRPHRRHAPPPGADRVGVPLRAGGAVPQPGEQGQPLGPERPRPAGLDQEPRLRGAGRSTASSPRRRSTCSGSAARARSTTTRRRPSGPPPSCCTGPGWTTWCSARRRAAPATRRAARATSSCSRCSRRRTSRCSTTVFEGREPGTRKIVTTCPHCLNTLGREYPQLGRALRGGAPHAAAQQAGPRGQARPGRRPRRRDGGRDLPRPVLPGPAQRGLRGAPRARRRRRGDAWPRCRGTPTAPSAAAPAAPACGWRRRSASGSTSSASTRRSAPAPRQIATGCPFCRVMFTDGLTQRQSEDKGTDVEILDVSQMLLRVRQAR